MPGARHRGRGQRRAELAQDKFARRFKTAVQKNRAQHRLKRVGQRGRALAPAVRFLAAAQNQMRAQPQRAGAFGQRAAVDEFGARLRQRPFAERREIVRKAAASG